MRPTEIRFQLAVHALVLSSAELRERTAEPLIAAVAAEGLLLSGRAPRPLHRVRHLPAAPASRPARHDAAGVVPAAADTPPGARGRPTM